MLRPRSAHQPPAAARALGAGGFEGDSHGGEAFEELPASGIAGPRAGITIPRAVNGARLLARATKQALAPRALLEEILQTEAADRARRSLERRQLKSRLGSFKPIADFDWNWPKKIDRPLLERALTLDFVREGRNLLLLGPNGIGKTVLAKNIAHQAVLAGYSVLFRTAPELLDDVSCDSPERRRRKIAAYTRPHLLCIDEIGYLSYDDHAADLLYKIINPRYEKRRSLIVSTNLAFKNWNTIFPNATCIVTLIDRLIHHADVTLIEGESYRHHESEAEAAARRQRLS